MFITFLNLAHDIFFLPCKKEYHKASKTGTERPHVERFLKPLYIMHSQKKEQNGSPE